MHDFVIHSIDQKRLDEVVAEIKAAGGDVIGVPGDVAADDFPKKIVDTTIKFVDDFLVIWSLISLCIQDLWQNQSYCKQWLVFHSSYVTQLICHTTAGFTFDKMLHTTPDDAFDIIMKIHVRAPFRLIRQAAPYFRIKVSLNQDRLQHIY